MHEAEADLPLYISLLNRLAKVYVAPDAGWWPAGQATWRAGVRYVLVQKQTSLAPPNLERFSTGPTPLVRTA